MWNFEFKTVGLEIAGTLALIGGVILLTIYQQGTFTWRRLARRPLKALQRGDFQGAERAYRKARARAQRFPAEDWRRGIMLSELVGFLVFQGRRQDARRLAEECVEILARNVRKMPNSYFVTLKDFAVFLIDGKEFAAAQRVLERGIDEVLVLKKPMEQSKAEDESNEFAPFAEWDFILHLVLAYLLLEAGQLHQTKMALQEVDGFFGRMDPRGQNANHDSYFVLRALWHCSVGQFQEAERLCAQTRVSPADLLLARVQAKVGLARQDYAGVEQMLRLHLDLFSQMGTTHRPELSPQTLALAESLFGQAKHDDAFAALQDARSIVADFTLPADDNWCKTLMTWLQRAKDLGRAELAASLEFELAQVSATPNQAITILEKFRIQPPASQ